MEEEEYETPNVVRVDEPIGFYDEGSPYLDIDIPRIVWLSDDEDRYIDRPNDSEDGFIWALDGDDYIWARSHGVSVFAGDGDDTIVWSYRPPKLIDGGDGIDTLDLSLLPRGAKVDLQTGVADTHVPLFFPFRTVEVRNVENVIGTDHDDHIYGNGADNVLMGGAGSDILFGGGGDDELHSGSSDLGSRDVLIGGSGADRFVFNTAEESKMARDRDVIADFEQGVDTLVFHSTVVVPSIEFRGPDYDPGDVFEVLDPRESYLRVSHSSQPGMPETTEVTLHLSDGSFRHEFSAITLVGHHDLTAGDFMFV